ncbi:MAG: hypothetical protein ACTHKA_17495 [Anaerocolumna jejuensis]
MKVRAVYKCRLCGEIFYPSGTSNKNLAMEVTIAAAAGIKHEEISAPRICDIHACKDGSYGVADFHGMQNDSN